MPENNEQAWERIKQGKYLCCFCRELFEIMKLADRIAGPTAAMKWPEEPVASIP